jgi:hypothetical protein
MATPIITIWTGTLADIPTGWELCDGNDGRPNLLDKFVKGVSSAEEPGGTGGNSSHTHTIDAHDTHHHTKLQTSGNKEDGTTTSWSTGGSTTNVAHPAHPAISNDTLLPSYYKIAFIYNTTSDIAVKAGVIIIWSGAVDNIPSGFHICDGTENTPDLINKFVYGIPDGTTNPGGTGGSATHNHGGIGSCETHKHKTTGSGVGATSGASYSAVSAYTSTGGAHSHTIDPASNEPLYYTIAYIQATTDTCFPQYGVCMWSGALADIPEGFQLCDGTNSTQDLRERFLKGASTGYASGGNINHSHTTSSDGSHSHTTPKTLGTGSGSASGAYNTVAAGSHSHTLSTVDNNPPHYKLAFIALILVPTIVTNDATNITSTSAKLHGSITDVDDLSITQYGFDYTDEQGNWKWST